MTEPIDEGAAQPLAQILALAEEGAWHEVADRLRGMLEDGPDDGTVLTWLGVAELELGLEGVAYERFRRALEGEPTDPTVLATAGAALARLDDPAAEGALRSAALLGPDVAAARLHYGAYLTREGMFEDALAELTAALTLEPNDAVVQRELGTLFGFTNRPDQAVEAYEAAIRTDPQDAQAHLLLGLTLLEQGSSDAASGALAAGARYAGHDVAAQLVAALAAQQVGAPDRAAEYLERARLVASSDELEAVLDVEDALSGEPEDGEELLLDLAAAELRRRRAERP